MHKSNGMTGPSPFGTAGDPQADTRPKLQLDDGRLLPMSDMQKLRLDLYNSRSQTLQLQGREINRLMAENEQAQQQLLAEVVEADRAHQAELEATNNAAGKANGHAPLALVDAAANETTDAPLTAA